MGDGQIVVSGLTKLYRKVRAVDDLSSTVEAGRVTGFLRPNGAGKTTTLRILLNLVTATSGTATIGVAATPTCPTRCARSARSSRRPARIAAAAGWVV